MKTEGTPRHVSNDGNVFLMLLPRVGIAARGKEFFDFLNDHADDGWEWSQPFSSRKGKTEKEILEDIAYMEKHSDWRLWHKYDDVIGTGFELTFQGAPHEKWHRYDRVNFHLGRSSTFFPLEDFLVAWPMLGDEAQVRPKEFFILTTIVEMFKPHYGFIYDGMSFENQSSVLPYDYPKNIEKIAQTDFMKQPWSYYSRTMLFGPKLIESYGRERLLAAPAYRILDMPNDSLLMQGPGGFYDVERLDVNPIDAWRSEDDILFEYDGDLARYLGLSTDLMNYL